jgi:voltage-gated potassium channel
MRVFIPRFLGALAYLLVLTAVGMVGYVAVEGWSWREALYMTVITMSAVGFQEVHPLSDLGRNFTMVLLAAGITGVGVWFALITSFIVEFDLSDVRKKRRRARMLNDLDGHIILCGGGRTGRQVMEELVALGQDFVVIERDAQRLEWISERYPEVLIVVGDATLDVHLRESGILKANGLLACLSADSDNVFVCLSARDLNPDLTIVARALEEGSMGKLYRAGADHVVSPNVSGAIRMASMLLHPEVVSFLDIVTRAEGLELRFDHAVVGPQSRLAGRTLLDARIPQETGLIFIAVRKQIDQEREYVFNPSADTRLDVGDEMMVLGEPDQVTLLRNFAEA